MRTGVSDCPKQLDRLRDRFSASGRVGAALRTSTDIRDRAGWGHGRIDRVAQSNMRHVAYDDDVFRRPINQVKRTQRARRALREIEAALLPLLTCTLSDLVAYGEMTFSGRVLEQGPTVRK